MRNSWLLRDDALKSVPEDARSADVHVTLRTCAHTIIVQLISQVNINS